MTEHVEGLIDTSAMTLRGTHSGVLFVNGNEVKSANGDRLLVIPGDASLDGSDKLIADQIAANTRSRGALSVIAYPNEFKSSGNSYDGIEVYNVFTNARKINLLVAFLMRSGRITPIPICSSAITTNGQVKNSENGTNS
jgi:hypothetical protein